MSTKKGRIPASAEKVESGPGPKMENPGKYWEGKIRVISGRENPSDYQKR